MDKSENLLREEAYALALGGHVERSLRLLEGVDRTQPDASSVSLTADASRLLLARLLLARADPRSRIEATKILSDLNQGGGETGWRAGIELARLTRSEGDLAAAIALLTQAIERFRASADGQGTTATRLTQFISDEVEILRSASSDGVNTGESPSGRGRGLDSTASDPEFDRASLLRLVDLGKRLATEGDPDKVLRIVLHEAIDLSGAARGFIVTLRDEEFDFVLAENMDGSEVEAPGFEVSRSLIRRVIGERRSILLNFSIGDSGSEMRSLAEIGVVSVACVPLVHEAVSVGALYLDAREPSHAFGNSMRRLFDLLASQAAAALTNAREHRAKTLALETAEATIRRHRSESERRVRFEGMIGACDAMQEVYRKLDQIVPTELPVMLLGETGTGKELAARLVHSRGPRRDTEFVATNCAAMTETLLESELFGHERGAFTGADRARAGLFEIANRGTLFLDEVGDMSPRMQANLLRVLETGEIRRVGGRETLRVNVRIISATHRNLEEMVRRDEFRQDLYFRLNVLSLRLPPLRERADDIPVLVMEFMAGLCPGKAVPGFADGVMRRLVAHSWPGNVRELQNVLRRLATLAVPVFEEEHLPQEIGMRAAHAVRPGTLRTAEAEAILRALEATRGNKVQAAKVLGVDRKTLYKKLRQLGSARSGGAASAAADRGPIRDDESS